MILTTENLQGDCTLTDLILTWADAKQGQGIKPYNAIIAHLVKTYGSERQASMSPNFAAPYGAEAVAAIDAGETADLPAAIARCANRLYAKDEKTLRRLLAVQVAGAGLYTDDGELQDNTAWPHIDFKRDTADQIEAKLIERAMITCAFTYEPAKLEQDWDNKGEKP